MSQVLVIKGEFFEGSDFKLLARVVSHNRAVLTTGDCSGTATTATINIYDLSGATPQTAIFTSTSLTSANLIQNTLLTSSSGWSQDSIGANFLLVISTQAIGSQFSGKGVVWPSGHPVGGHRYRIEVLIPTTDYGIVPIVAELTCRAVYSS